MLKPMFKLWMVVFLVHLGCGSEAGLDGTFPEPGDIDSTSTQAPVQLEKPEPKFADPHGVATNPDTATADAPTEITYLDGHPRLDGSYIISYKTPNQNPLLRGTYFSSHQDEYQFYKEEMAHELGQLSEGTEIESYTLFGTYDMNNRIPLDYDKALNFRSGMDLTSPFDFVKSSIGVIARVDFKKDEDAKKTLNSWQEAGKLWFSEPNYVNELFQNPVNPCTNQVVGTTGAGLFAECAMYTPLAEAQEVQAPAAYLALQGRPLKANKNDDNTLIEFPPIVAVFDSGIDVQHSFLSNRVFENSAGNIGQSGCNNDQFGCNTTTSLKDKLGDGDTFPFSTTGFDQQCSSELNCAHGTHVASIIAGDRNSTPGICVSCRVMPIKVTTDMDGEARILDSSLLAGFRYVSRFRNDSSGSAVRVINASLGKYTPNRAIQTMINVLHDQLNIVTVGAAGNEDSNRMSYVAGYSKVLAVAGLTQGGREKTRSSNYGIWVDVSAPGDDVTGSTPGGSTRRAPGTSFAAPFVAAAAGLMVARDPDLTADQIRDAIKNSADASIYNNNPVYAPTITIDGEETRVALLGRGLLNVAAAVGLTKNPNQIPEINNERITSFCGVVGSSDIQKNIPILLLILPLLFLVVGISKKRGY